MIEKIQNAIKKLLLRPNTPQSDPIVTTAEIKTSGSIKTQVLLRESGIVDFDPSIMHLNIEVITSSAQRELVCEEMVYLAQNSTEVAQYLNLQGLLEDYDEELREF